MLVVTRGGYRPTSDHEPAVEAEPFYGNDGEIDDASSPVACSCLDAPGRRRTCLRTVTRCRRRAGAHQSRGRSEERRVGKECKFRWPPNDYTKKRMQTRMICNA